MPRVSLIFPVAPLMVTALPAPPFSENSMFPSSFTFTSIFSLALTEVPSLRVMVCSPSLLRMASASLSAFS